MIRKLSVYSRKSPQFPISAFPLNHILLVVYHCGECLWVEHEELLPQAFIPCTILDISGIVKSNFSKDSLNPMCSIIVGWHHFNILNVRTFKNVEIKAVSAQE